MDWRFIISLLLAIVVAVFAIQNAETVNVAFFTFDLSVSQALVILISAVVGAITVMLLSIVRWLRYRGKIKNLTKHISTLEGENALLKRKLEQSLPHENKTPVNITASHEDDPQ